MFQVNFNVFISTTLINVILAGMCKHICKHTNMHKMPPLTRHSSLLAQLCKTNTGSERRWSTQNLLEATVEREGTVISLYVDKIYKL